MRFIIILFFCCFSYVLFGQTKNEIIEQLTNKNSELIEKIKSVDSTIFSLKFELVKLNTQNENLTKERNSEYLDFIKYSNELKKVTSDVDNYDIDIRNRITSIKEFKTQNISIKDSIGYYERIYNKLQFRFDSLSIIKSNSLSSYPKFKGDWSKYSNVIVPFLNPNGKYSLVKFNSDIPVIDKQFLDVSFLPNSDLIKVKEDTKSSSDWSVFNSGKKTIWNGEYELVEKIGDFYILDFDIYSNDGTKLGSIKDLIISYFNKYRVTKFYYKNIEYNFDKISIFFDNYKIENITVLSDNHFCIYVTGQDGFVQDKYILKFDPLNKVFSIEPISHKIQNNVLYRPRDIHTVFPEENNFTPNYIFKKINVKDSDMGGYKDIIIKNDSKIGKVGIVDVNDKILVNFIYDKISEFHFGFSIVELSGIKYLIDIYGNLINKDINSVEFVPVRFLNEFIVLLSNGNFLNLNSLKIIQTDKSVFIDTELYDKKEEVFNCGLIKVKSLVNGKYGFMRLDGKLEVQPKFIHTTSFDNGFAIIYDEYHNLSIIDLKGEKINDQKYSTIYSLTPYFQFPYNGHFGYENRFGLYETDQYGTNRNNDNIEVIDGFFKLFNGFFKVKREGRVFFVDLNGKEYFK